MARAVVLLSGGLDSATCLGWARAHGFECVTLAVDYGQRHRVELAAARRVAEALGVSDHREVRADLRAIGGSALTADLEHAERLIGERGVPRGRLMLMPEGMTAEVLAARGRTLAEACKRLGVRLSPRLQVWLWGARRGV